MKSLLSCLLLTGAATGLALASAGCHDALAPAESVTTPTFAVHFYEATPVTSKAERRVNVRAMTRASYELRTITGQPAAPLDALQGAVASVVGRYGTDAPEARFARALAAHYALERLLLPGGLTEHEVPRAAAFVGDLQATGLVDPEVLAPALDQLAGRIPEAQWEAAVAFARTPPPPGSDGTAEAGLPVAQANQRALAARQRLVLMNP